MDLTSPDYQMMVQAIGLARECKPVRPDIPRVGAVIAVNGVSIGSGRRDDGSPDDNHAEWNALGKVHERTQLSSATLYTTLEPCTPDVRSKPSTCCTHLILQHQIKRVFIGILDPNQGVRGKGFWQLQSEGVEVEVFPPELAGQIRALNADFIRLQQSYGIRILSPLMGSRHTITGNYLEVKMTGSFENAPGPDVFAISVAGNQWWPQRHILRIPRPGEWETSFSVGGRGPHDFCIVKASQLAIDLIEYYRKVVRENQKRHELIGQTLAERPEERDKLFKQLPGIYSGIVLRTGLPKGLEILDQVRVEIV